MRLYKSLAIVAVLLLVAALSVRGEEKKFIATVDADGVQHVEMTAGSYFYDPNRIEVKVNVPVEIKIKKESGLVPHDIIFDAPEAGIKARADLKSDPVTINFTPTKTGEYPFYCGKKAPFTKSHREKGMEGVIVVTP